MGYELDVLETPLSMRKKVNEGALLLMVWAGLLPQPVFQADSY